jgi:hypothetical protein
VLRRDVGARDWRGWEDIVVVSTVEVLGWVGVFGSMRQRSRLNCSGVNMEIAEKSNKGKSGISRANGSLQSLARLSSSFPSFYSDLEFLYHRDSQSLQCRDHNLRISVASCLRVVSLLLQQRELGMVQD